MVATSHRNGFNILPKWYQYGCQMDPGGLLEASWRLLGALKKAWSAKGWLPGAYGALLERSWRPPGPPKTSALGRPEGTQETGFSDLGGQMPSQKEFRRVPNQGPKVIQAENVKITNFVRHLTKSLDV